MTVISIDYKKADSCTRSAFVLGTEAVLEMLEQLKVENVKDAVYLSTCNRAELYLSADKDIALKVLSEYAHVNEMAINELITVYEENDAIMHLFRVCAGLESMVLGEDEILGQMKAAYALSRENGNTTFLFNTIFQSAFSCAKKIKTDTLLSKSSVSVATIAAFICHNFMPGRKSVLIIGATSEIGRKLVKNLLSYKDADIIATKRHTVIAEDGVSTVTFDERYQYVDWADIVISCTKSPHHTLSADKIRSSIKNCKPRLFVDLAVPSDIDKDVTGIEGVELVTIDEISEHARENNERKISEAIKAEAMISEAVDELLKTIHFRDFIPAFNRIKDEMAGDFSKFLYKYRDLATLDEFMSFIGIIKRMEEGE